MLDFNLDFDLKDTGSLGLDLGFLDATELDGQKVENRYCLPSAQRDVKKHVVKYDHAEAFAADVGKRVLRGETVAAVLSGNFIFGDFFEAFAVTQNLLIDELTISTLSVSQENVDSFQNLFNGGYLNKLDLIVSDYFWSHNRHNAPYIYKSLDIGDRFQLAVAGIHTKIALMRVGDKKIIISGSANLRSSRCLEEITIQTDPDLYDFHNAWHTVILDRYSTIKKAVRASALFDMITRGVEDKEKWEAT